MTLIGFLDLETTGKLHPEHRIIELSLRIYNLEKRKEIKSIIIRFNPERNIDAKALAVHGITVKELAHEPFFRDKVGLLVPVIKALDYLVAHNGIGFDFPFLDMEIRRAGITSGLPSGLILIDTMLEGNFATELGKAPSLKELAWCASVGYDEEEAHSGDYDTKVMMDSFLYLFDQGWFKLDNENRTKEFNKIEFADKRKD